jgi:glutamyl-tRNA synthetase
MILRIEDTDVARSRDEWVQGIQDTLHWLGIDWDEGPVLQSSRFDRYRSAADALLEAGRAYECFCTEDEVRARNEAARAAGRPPGYDGHCRDLSGEERAALAAEGRPRTIRFRTPTEGTSEFHDVVRGDVAVAWSLIHDFVIMRSDGTPIFFLANAVDDLDMAITHVIRGEDLLDSTHRVLALRAALGADHRPVFAHLPLIVDTESRAKLSKRHGAVGLEELRDEGYLPEALLNYIALLGWAPADGEEVMPAKELIARFDLDRVTHAAAGYDRKKLDWMNGEWIRRLDLDDLVRRTEPDARRRFGARFDPDVFRHALRVAQERAVTLTGMVALMDFLFVDEDEFSMAPDAWDRVVATERIEEILDTVRSHLDECDWRIEAIDLRPVLDAMGLKPRKVMKALYTVIEGTESGLPLFDSIWLLGRDRAVGRIDSARSRL